MNLKDMKISTRLILGFGMLVLLIAFMGGMSLIKLVTVEDTVHRMTDERMPRVAMLNEVKDHVSQIGMSLRNMSIMSDPSDIKKQEETVLLHRKTTGELVDKLKAQIKTEKGTALLGKIADARGGYVSGQTKYIELVNGGKVDEAKPFLLSMVRPAQLAYVGAIEELIRLRSGLQARWR
jgi:methyl-accepting chemotaxis protein